MSRKQPQRRKRPVSETTEDAIARLQAANARMQEELRQLNTLDDERALEEILIRALIDRSPDYLYVKDTQSRFVIANRALAADSGFARPSDLTGKTDFDIHALETAQRFFTDEQNIMWSGQTLVDREELIITSTGEKRWYASTKLPLRNQQNEVVGILGIARNITDRKRAEDFRAENARILEMIASNAPLEEVLDRLTRVIESQLFGIRASILLLDADGLHLRHGAAPSMPEAYTSAIDGVAIGPNVGSCGTAAFRRESVIVTDVLQDPLWEAYRDFAAPFGFRACWSSPVLSHQGVVLGTFALYCADARGPDKAESKMIDIATHIAGIAIERKQAERRIYHMAHHDALTGLPNRTLLKDRLAQAILYAQRDQRTVTVAFIDLDNFKLINDSLGHTAGDELLKVFAERMVQCVRAADTVVRLGGDEFVVLLIDHPAETETVNAAIQRLKARLAETVFIDGQALQVTCSIGLASFPNDGTDVDTLLMNADAAMYHAKELGRNNCQLYTPALNSKNQERLSLQEGLRNAIAREEFMLLYQPQIDLRSGRIFAVEALIRWRHPELGMQSPNTFIPQAEENGLIVPIGDWALRTACLQNKAWQNAGAPPICMSVNVSARQFMDPEWTSRVAQALQETGLEARYLELELTESLIVQDVHQAIVTMRELQAMGVQLSIDDFGTGYSNLNALKSFPVGRLKIDQSFVRGIPGSEDDKAIASAVISLGHQLNLKVIAEGVETEQQRLFLHSSNCDQVQGYHFSRPVEAHAILDMLMQQMQAES